VKQARTVIDYNGETYMPATEVARRFSISWGTCRRNVLPHLEACYLPGRRRTFYRLSDIEQFSAVRVEKSVALERSVSQNVPPVAKLVARSAAL
jgi:hypothetical protein